MTANEKDPVAGTKSTRPEAPAEAASDAPTGNPVQPQPTLPEGMGEMDRRAIDTVRVLAMDAVQNVGNGHPGTAMSLAPAAYLLFRPLWASTGVKNPDCPDTLYVSNLIAPDTVNTMPEKTLKAYADHGRPGTPVQKTYDDAAHVMKTVAAAGVDLDDVFRVLEDEGIQKFVDSWNELTESVRSELEDKR